MIETETLLERCPRCGAWPMAANVQKTVSVLPDVHFRCPRCHAEEAGRLSTRAFQLRYAPRDAA